MDAICGDTNVKRWRRIALIVGLLIALTLGGLYEASTYVVRGWLRGEAFFEGRPTSYWRGRCDEWSERFNDEYGLRMTTWLLPFEYAEDPGQRVLDPLPECNRGFMAGRHPVPTYWTRIRDAFRSEAEIRRERDYRFSPAIFRGSPDAQAVLEELANEEKYQVLANLGLQRIAQIRVHYEEFKKEMAIP
jgi:hypothetical protein